jgi:sirohydrochlorin ferrochelatase
MNLESPHTALLLIAHGSRRPDANADLEHLVGQLRERGRFLVVEPSYLEFAEPTILDGAARCVAQGAGRLILLPYFLSAGVHVQRDLAGLRDELGRRYPHVEVRLAEPLGRHPLLAEVVAQRADEANRP